MITMEGRTSYYKKHIHQQNRKKILFREVVQTTRQAYEVLKQIVALSKRLIFT